MASPRSMFSGVLSLGLLNIPITIGKSWSESREPSLMTVNVDADGNVERILRNEHLASGKPIEHKQKAVEVNDGEFRLLSENEFAAIEESTKTATLKVLDVQPLKYLPLIFSTGAYYCRHDKKSKADTTAMAILTAALAKTQMGLVVKWGSSSRQKLAVISADSGVLILRVIPFAQDVRLAGKDERGHWMEIQKDDPNLEAMTQLLKATQAKTFDYASYEDDGLKLRQMAVDRILAGMSEEDQKDDGEKVEQIDPGEMLGLLEKSLSALTQ